MSSVGNNWFVCPRTIPEAGTRFFLFPYAGSGPAAFNRWASELPDSVEVWIAHYPGRGSRHQEAPLTQIRILAEQLFQAIQPLVDRPFAFFGHSLGGLIAFELAREFQQQNSTPPELLFVSGCGAPHLGNPNPAIHAFSDSEFEESLRQLNGTPAELLDHPDVMQVLLPILRADFEAMERYQYDPGASRLPVPIVALAGLNDPRVTREQTDGWELHTDAGFRAYYFPGDHFFLHSCQGAVITCIS
jgi:medium-chain acyl-[acyl-carrier-protein] hydrolase